MSPRESDDFAWRAPPKESDATLREWWFCPKRVMIPPRESTATQREWWFCPKSTILPKSMIVPKEFDNCQRAFFTEDFKTKKTHPKRAAYLPKEFHLPKRTTLPKIFQFSVQVMNYFWGVQTNEDQESFYIGMPSSLSDHGGRVSQISRMIPSTEVPLLGWLIREDVYSFTRTTSCTYTLM